MLPWAAIELARHAHLRREGKASAMRDGRTGVLCVALRGWAVGLVGLVSGAGGEGVC